MTSFRNWCFTINNWVDEDLKVFENKLIKYVIFGKEIGESGTPHLQGYLELFKKSRLSALKKIHEKAHWENRRGNQDQAIEYCKKENNFIEIGEKNAQGERTDLEEIKDLIDKNTPMLEIADEYFGQYIRYNKGFEKYMLLKRNSVLSKQPEKKNVKIYWGVSGSGKSYSAHEEYPNAYVKPQGDSWWDGYDNQENVIIDEFTGWLPWNVLLSLTHEHNMPLPVKGGYLPNNIKNIVFCSNINPRDWYKDKDFSIFERRIDEIIEFTKKRDDLKKTKYLTR